MKTYRALAVYAFVALLCSFLVVRWVFSAPLLKADDTIVLTTADLPQGYRLVADTGFQTREMALVTGTGEKEKHQPYTVRERRQDVALPGQADADGARISVTMMVFPSVEMAMAYCEQQMEVYVFEGGTLRTDPHWHTSRNDLGDPHLAGKGGAVRSDPSTLLIRYGNVFCQISAGSFNPKCSEAVALLGKIWLEKISRAPAGTVAVEEGSTKPDVTGAPKGTAPATDIDNDIVRVKIDPNRACVTNLTFKRGSNAELIASGWGSYLIDLGTDPKLGKYLKEGWVAEKVEHRANYSKFLFRHPSGFINEMVLSWGEGGVEVRCDITAPESVEISGVLRPGGGWESGRDKWAFPTSEGIKTGNFTYPGPHIPLYPPDHSWGTPTENWIALWDDQVNEVYGFTFSGGSKAKICNGAGADQHILVPVGTSRVSFHIVKPKPGTPYEAIRALINAPSTLIGRQTEKPEEGSTKPDVTGTPKGTAPTTVAGTGAKDASGFYIVDLSPYASYGGRKGTPRQVKGVMIDDSSHIRIEPAGMKLLSFEIKLPQPVSASSVAIVSLLGHAHYLPDDFTIVALTVYTNSGNHRFEFKAGIHTSEWNRNESGGAAHRWPKETYLDAHNGQNRWMAVFQLPNESTVTGLRFDYADKDIDRKYYYVGNPPVFALLGITLIGRQTEKPEGYHLSEGKPQSATGGVPAGSGHVKSFAGRWNTNWGLMEITVVGNKVYGHYEHDQGKIEGTLSADGRTVEGTWSEAPTYKPPKDAGKFRLTLSDDGDSFTGSCGYGESVTGVGDWKGTRIKGEGEPQGATGGVPAGTGRQDAYHLSGGDSSVPLHVRYQPADGFLRLELRFSKPGSVLDTVGINAAKAGDFAIWILPDNVLVWQIYHPGIASNVRAPNGWHILRSQSSLQPERWYSVEVTWGKRGARLVIDGKVHAQVDVNLPLSGSEVFLGDFPGDAQWAPRYEVNRSFTGDVRNIVFGP